MQSLLPLLGVVVGAVTTFAMTFLNERARWKRERKVRWDESRMRAYFDYGNAVKAVHLSALRLGCGAGYPHSVEPVVPDEAALEELSVTEAERGQVWEGVLLLGDPETIDAARSWHESVWQIQAFAQGRLTGIDGWESAVGSAERARDRYYDCARKDLDVVGRLRPTPAWRSRSLARQVAAEHHRTAREYPDRGHPTTG